MEPGLHTLGCSPILEVLKRGLGACRFWLLADPAERIPLRQKGLRSGALFNLASWKGALACMGTGPGMGTALGTGAVESLGSAGRGPVGAEGGGEKSAADCGGDAMSECHTGSARVVAERGTITVGFRPVGADIGVGVEKRLISYTRDALTGTCFGEFRVVLATPTPFDTDGCCCCG